MKAAGYPGFRDNSLCGLLSVLLVGLLSVLAGAQVKKPPVDPCEPREMMRSTYQGDLVKALAKSEACIAYYEKEAGPDGDLVKLGGPSNLYIGYYMCAKVQLFAMMNATSDAEHALFELESFADFHHPSFSSFLFADGWNDMLDLTRGMVLEKEGKTAQARDAYRQCRPLNLNSCSGRLALLALVEKNDGQAEGWARSGAVFGDPTALGVLGALAEGAGHGAEAYQAYSDAQRKMEEMLDKDGPHNFLPAFLSEHRRLQEGLSRVVRPSGPRVVESGGKRRFYGEDERVAGWDRWPHILYSADVKNKQDEYDTWLLSFSPFPRGFALKPQYPRFFLGFSKEERSKLADLGFAMPTGGSFGIPRKIEPTGVLDLDTLAIPFYKGVVEVSELANELGLGLDDLQIVTDPQGGSDHDANRSAEILELKQAVDALKDLYGVLKNITFTTSAGTTFNASGEARQYTAFYKAEEGKAIDFDAPPDFVTAHLDAQFLTPEFIGNLVTRETEVKSHIRAARQIAHP
jgi:hypothetical protein